MKTTAILLATGAIIAAAPVAHADIPWALCPSGRSGVASSVTSCEFADNVESAYLRGGDSGYEVVNAYSPVTGQVYTMSCVPNVSTFTNGAILHTALCQGGTDARVVVL